MNAVSTSTLDQKNLRTGIYAFIGALAMLAVAAWFLAKAFA